MVRTAGLRLTVALLALALVASACGDDDDTTDTTTTAAADTTDTTTTAAADTTEAPATTAAPDEGGDAAAGDLTELCALAEEMFNNEDLPTNEQIEQYAALAPDEIAAEVDLAGGAIISAGGDPVAFFAAIAEDDVEAALDTINAFEEENCGIPHTEQGQPPLPPGASDEVEPDAARVDVTAVDYGFEFDEPIAPGRTSFVLINEGAEAHFLGVVKLAEGADLQTALESEDDSAIEGFWESGIAAPGGEDDEVITFDLEPGNYGFVCFLPAADGTPHAFLGMAVPITVS